MVGGDLPGALRLGPARGGGLDVATPPSDCVSRCGPLVEAEPGLGARTAPVRSRSARFHLGCCVGVQPDASRGRPSESSQCDRGFTRDPGPVPLGLQRRRPSGPGQVPAPQHDSGDVPGGLGRRRGCQSRWPRHAIPALRTVPPVPPTPHAGSTRGGPDASRGGKSVEAPAVVRLKVRVR